MKDKIYCMIICGNKDCYSNKDFKFDELDSF